MLKTISYSAENSLGSTINGYYYYGVGTKLEQTLQIIMKRHKKLMWKTIVNFNTK